MNKGPAHILATESTCSGKQVFRELYRIRMETLPLFYSLSMKHNPESGLRRIKPRLYYAYPAQIILFKALVIALCFIARCRQTTQGYQCIVTS
jgi:hypothetical protein